MRTKWIRHPNLPDGQEVEVPAQSVGHYSHSGWEIMDGPPEWATVRPEDANLAELSAVARDAAGMPEPPTDGKPAPKSDEELSEIAQKASGTSEPDDSEDQEDKPTDTKRSRRAPTKEGK
jgi:hypothetical protein